MYCSRDYYYSSRYIYVCVCVKEGMNLQFNKTKIFSKDFYLQHKSLPCYSFHWLGSSQLTTECQTQKCLSCSEKVVNHLTFGLWQTTQHHVVLWGHSEV